MCHIINQSGVPITHWRFQYSFQGIAIHFVLAENTTKNSELFLYAIVHAYRISNTFAWVQFDVDSLNSW